MVWKSWSTLIVLWPCWSLFISHLLFRWGNMASIVVGDIHHTRSKGQSFPNGDELTVEMNGYSWVRVCQLLTAQILLSGCLCQIQCFLKDVLLKCANLKLVHTRVNFRSNSEIGWMLDQYKISLERNAYSFHHGCCLELTEKGGNKRQIDSCLFCYCFSTFYRQCSPSLPAWKGSERESWGGLLPLPHPWYVTAQLLSWFQLFMVKTFWSSFQTPFGLELQSEPFHSIWILDAIACHSGLRTLLAYSLRLSSPHPTPHLPLSCCLLFFSLPCFGPFMISRKMSTCLTKGTW